MVCLISRSECENIKHEGDSNVSQRVRCSLLNCPINVNGTIFMIYRKLFLYLSKQSPGSSSERLAGCSGDFSIKDLFAI